MKAVDFISLGLEYGDKVKVYFSPTNYKEGFFAGYKTYSGTESVLEYLLFPVFYGFKKDGTMGRKPMDGCYDTHFGLSNIYLVVKEDSGYNDINGSNLFVGKKVYWHDEAGYDREEGSWIEFKIVEEDGNGYFNIKYDGEKNPERWAWHKELQVIED